MATTDPRAEAFDPFAEYPAYTGIRNDVDPERFGLADLVDAVNVDLDDRGRPKRRAGSARVHSIVGGAHSLYAPETGDPILFTEGATLKRLAPDLATSSALATVTTGARRAYAEHAGRVYSVNGFEPLVIENGAARRWGIAPPAGVTAQAAGGQLPAGRYLYTATYLAADGRESGALPAEAIDIAGGGITVAIPDSDDPQVAAKCLYVSTANGEALYEAGITSAASLTFSDTTARLQRPITTLLCMPPPADATEVAIYRGTAFVAAGPIVLASEPFALEHFRGDRLWPLPDAVTLLAPAEDGLYISTERETLWFGGATVDDMSVVRRHGVGAVRGSLAMVPAGDLKVAQGEAPVPVWLSAAGLVAGLPGGTLVNLSHQWRFDAPAAGASVFFQGANGSRLITTFHGA